jgi:dsDNA-specific endonuclease/ATPase MutS2
MVIITGPNTGGKTVSLKTVGLLTLAVQSGFHIPCEQGSEFSVFENIFADIGDDQSIENALSTFSSHVKNIAQIIRNTNKSTLLLFDEIGSGTEPNEGTALAISVLEEVYYKGAVTVATTHYGEIKDYSFNHPDFENAAMLFNSETLEPLFKLLIGESGDSNAFWIAEKMGISKSVVERARDYIADKEYNFDTINKNKIIKVKSDELTDEKEEIINFDTGDRVYLTEYKESGIVYKPKDKFNNLIILYKNEFKEVNVKQLKLECKARELYPEDYDLNTLFVDYAELKLERDIRRGSKKALKEINKKIKSRRNDV